MTDNVNHPAHYTQWPIEVIDLTEREGFLYGNVLKYVLRAGAKPGAAYEEDMAKAVWYATRFVTRIAEAMTCLLSTSDAADEEDSLDLRGRRTIQKKTPS